MTAWGLVRRSAVQSQKIVTVFPLLAQQSQQLPGQVTFFPAREPGEAHLLSPLFLQADIAEGLKTAACLCTVYMQV